MTDDERKEAQEAVKNPVLRLIEIRVPEDTKDVTGRAFSYAFISTCDGIGFVESRHLTAALDEIERLREQNTNLWERVKRWEPGADPEAFGIGKWRGVDPC